MKVGVIATGTLGPSIAQVFAQCGQNGTVYLCKGRESLKRNGKYALERSLSRLVAKGKMEPARAHSIMEKIVIGPKSILHDADLIVEAVSENLEIKQAVFRELDGICKQECVFATNTSSLPIKAVGEELSRPMIGMHFCNPAPVMKLGANHPLGPLALGDLIGLDVVLPIMEVMLKETGDIKYRPQALLKRMVREGKLGRKSGEGFYQYTK